MPVKASGEGGEWPMLVTATGKEGDDRHLSQQLVKRGMIGTCYSKW